jgi:hypothetical protein
VRGGAVRRERFGREAASRPEQDHHA